MAQKLKTLVHRAKAWYFTQKQPQAGVLLKKVSLKIWQCSQENTCVRVFKPALLLKRDSNTISLGKIQSVFRFNK